MLRNSCLSIVLVLNVDRSDIAVKFCGKTFDVHAQDVTTVFTFTLLLSSIFLYSPHFYQMQDSKSIPALNSLPWIVVIFYFTSITNIVIG